MELAIFFSVAIQKHPFNNVWHIVWDKKAIYLAQSKEARREKKEKKWKCLGLNEGECDVQWKSEDDDEIDTFRGQKLVRQNKKV